MLLLTHEIVRALPAMKGTHTIARYNKVLIAVVEVVEKIDQFINIFDVSDRVLLYAAKRNFKHNISEYLIRAWHANHSIQTNKSHLTIKIYRQAIGTK